MKNVNMMKWLCNGAGWSKCDHPATFKRVSRWITVQHNYTPGKNNSLWDYVTDENGYKPYQEQFTPENGLFLDFFRWNGRTWAVEQFLALGNPFWCPVSYAYEDSSGKLCYLSGVDNENIYNPIYVEFDECCERVRVYEGVNT